MDFYFILISAVNVNNALTQILLTALFFKARLAYFLFDPWPNL